MKILFTILCALLAFTGCMPQGKIHSQVESIVIFEQQIHSQVNILSAAFESEIALLPPEQQKIARDKFLAESQKLETALDAKDRLLQAALAASAETVDVTAAVVNIVAAVQDIIAVVAMFGAKPEFIQEHQQKARSLTVLR